MKKKIALMLAVALSITAFAGCGKKTANEGEITLKMVLPGPGKQTDSDMVWAEVNKKLKTYPGMENVTLDIQVLPTSDYSQKFVLWQTSGEKIDIAQTYTLNYATEAQNGSFLPLDEYIDKSEGLKDAFPEFMWGYANVNGKHYYVPNYQVVTSVDYSFATPKALADKYWDTEKAEAVMAGEKTFTNKCWDVLEDYLSKLSDAGEIALGYEPLDSLTHTLQKGVVQAATRFYYYEDDPEHKIMYMDEIPERVDGFKRLSDFYKKGYVRKDISSAQGSDVDYGKNGGYTLWHFGTHADPVYEKQQKNQMQTKYNMDISTVMTKDYDITFSYNAAGGMAIMVNSEYPDKAFRAIELLNTEEGKELYNMFAFGLEDKHYKKIGDNEIETLYVSQGSSTTDYGLYKWNTGNTKYAYKLSTEGIDPAKTDEINTAETVKYTPLTGFVLDTSEIETELAQIDATFGEYIDLNKGNLPDVEKSYSEYMEKVKKAGVEKVKAEIQKQVDAFLKNK